MAVSDTTWESPRPRWGQRRPIVRSRGAV